MRYLKYSHYAFLALLIALLPLAPQPEFDGLQSLRRAESHLSASEYTAADAAYQQASHELPASPYPLWGLAVLYERWGYPQEGLQALAAATTYDYANKKRAESLRFRLLAAAGEWKELESRANTQVAAQPSAPEPLRWLTQAQLQQLQCSEAAESAASWLEIAPYEPAAQRQWGALALDRSPGTAVTALCQADPVLCESLQSCSPPTECDAQLGHTLLRQGSPALAACVLQRAITAQPEAAATHVWLGAALGQLQRPAEALPQLELATELDPTSPLGWLLLGMHELNYGSLTRAREALLQAQELDPNNPAPCLGMAELLARQGKYNQIKTWTDAALERAPQDANVYHAVTRFYLERNLGAEGVALQAASQAVQLAPEAAESWLLQGWAYLNLGQVENALASLERALQLDPELAEAHQLRGESLMLLGQNAAAQDAFTLAADLGWKGRK